MQTKTVEIRTIIYAEHTVPDTTEIAADQWQRLATETEIALRAAYPGADISVEIRHGVRGVGSGTTYRMDGEMDDDRSEHCRAIAERAWERWCATAETADAS